MKFWSTLTLFGFDLYKNSTSDDLYKNYTSDDQMLSDWDGEMIPVQIDSHFIK